MAILKAYLKDARSDYEFECERGATLEQVKDSQTALSLVFDFMNDIMNAVLKFIDSNGIRNTYFLGKLPEESFANLLALEEIISENFRLELSSPFEGCDNISGDIWRGKELLNRRQNDAIIKLKFDKGAVDLPSHVHSVSDRVLIEYEGEGFFHPNFDKFERHTNVNMQTIPIKKGDIICFPRNVIHTFSTLNSTMGDFSYHLPFVELEDPVQYTMTKEIWYPKNRLT